MSEQKPQDGAALLDRINPQLAKQSTEICMRPDLLDAWEQANAELEDLDQKAKVTAGRLSANASKELKAKAAVVQDLEEQIAATAIEFTIRALPKDEWRELCEENPPRANQRADQIAGYNVTAVIDEAVRRGLLDPVFDDTSWKRLVAVINPGEWAELQRVAKAVNGAVTEAPKSATAARLLTRPSRSSAQPAPTE